jgi:phosphotriesterase-related protein
MMNRSAFIKTLSFLAAGNISRFLPVLQEGNKIITVRGPIDTRLMGNTLVHEHILVDFIGASNYSPTRWNDEEVVKKVLPYLIEVRNAGCDTLVDCTPNYLGRDVLLLLKLSELSGLNIITNTGYYGGSDNKFLPAHAFEESPEQLSARWISEWENGIDGTSVRPGFMKISVNPGPLTPISRKLVQAAALTHLKTGLVIASHTGSAVAAQEEIEILQQAGVSPEAFIWVHAQNEKGRSQYNKLAQSGTWVSLDGLNENNVSTYTEILVQLKKEKYLHRVLVSHDAGWYEPGKPDGGTFRAFNVLFTKLIPSLKAAGFSPTEIQQLIVTNPRQAFVVQVRKSPRK